MSDRKRDPSPSKQGGYDPATLLSLYNMQQQYAAAAGLGGLPGYAGLSSGSSDSTPSKATPSSSASGNLGTLGVAASQAASLGMNQASAAWWNMASQLAAQDYLVRLQAAATRDPTAYAALAAQSAQLEMLAQANAKSGTSSSKQSSSSARSSPSGTASPSIFDSLRLPSDTEIIKYTSSSTGPKVPGTTNRGRKKTISLDPSPHGNGTLSNSASNSRGSTPTFPAGLTIERKKPGRKPLDPNHHIPSSTTMVDKVEITKVPAGANNGRASSSSFQFSRKRSNSIESPGLDSKATNSANTDYFSSKSQIPTDYFASQALSGVFLAEQIRQQQLAAALESRIKESSSNPSYSGASGTSSTDFMQAALLMNKLGASSTSLLGAGSTETSKLLAIAAAAAQAANQPAQSATTTKPRKSRKAPQSGGGSNNSVAALLAASKVLQGSSLSQEEMELTGAKRPELTIEPVYKASKPDSSFDISDRGRRFENDHEQQQVTNSDPKDRLRIKTVSDSPEIRNLSDNDIGSGNVGNVSDSDSEENGQQTNHGNDTNIKNGDLVPRIRITNPVSNSSANIQTSSVSSSTNPSSVCPRSSGTGRYATVETAELRLPMKYGWVRETLVREYSKSGVRGDVTYYAPCGKKFKQYPDIMRYLEKNDMKELGRPHFSFSTKIFIGDFLKPTGINGEDGQEKYNKLTEQEMLDDVDKIRRENGWKPRKSSHQNTASNAAPSGSKDSNKHKISNLIDNMTPEQKILARLQAEMHLREQAAKQQEEIRLQKEALKYLKEAERLEKLEQARKEKEQKQQQILLAKKKKQEELQRQKQEENLRKLKEKEEKRQQQALAKEQCHDPSNDYGKAVKASLERERRRHHLILMKQLEAKKKNDEREKKKEELRLEKEKEKERKVEQKRLEVEIVAEMRKPIEDMCLSDHKDMPTFQRIPNLVLSGEAFANILMVYEFLHNFGERLGFDMDSLPSLSDLQAAFLNDPEAEEELLSVVIHLLVCAIDDPGIPTPHKHLTLLGQNLRQADITNTNVSEILKIYLTARGQTEVKNLHGVVPPETHSAKDRNREIPFCQKKMEEFNRLLATTKPYEMAQWVKDKPFLCLNPTEKAEILAFVCNELLFNKSVLHQIDGGVEKANKSKKIKLIVETKLRRLRSTQHRRFKTQTKPEQNNEGDTSTNVSHVEDTSEIGDDSMSVASEATNESPTKKGTQASKKKRGRKPKNQKKVEEEHEEEEEDEKLTDQDLADIEGDDQDDEKLTQEELQKKIEKTTKQLQKCHDDVSFMSNCLRANDLGQDRYRRRYWHLAHTGGIFVEGMESCEPWKLQHQGMPHCHKKGHMDNRNQDSDEEMEEEINDDEEAALSMMEQDDHQPPEKKPKLEAKEVEEMTEEKENNCEFKTPKAETKSSLISPKVTPNADKLNLFNHSAHFNMSLSPVVLNGSVTITPKAEPLATSSPMNNPNPNVIYPVPEKPWFSIINPSTECQTKFEELKRESCSTLDKTKALLQAQTPVNPQIALLELRLEQMKKANFCKERKSIPEDVSRGWWRTTDANDISELEKSCHMRGLREQQLVQNVRKTLDFCLDTCLAKTTKPLGPELNLEELVDLEDFVLMPGDAPGPDTPGKWSKEVALRVDKYILEQVEALEDKVASASMQVPGWKVPNKPDIESRDFRASCEAPSGPKDNRTDPISEARERLLDLEANIERRYLKAPLGFSNAEISLQTITSTVSKPSVSVSTQNNTPKRTTNTSLNISRQMSEKTENEEGDQEEKEESMNGNEESDDESNDQSKEDSAENEKSNLPRGLVTWREGVRKAQNAAQLAMGFYVLETSIAWHKSIMKAFCQLCHNGDHEDSLLLCDGCDKGYHMYCFKPPMTKVPEGDWYCFECINKATGVKHCLVCGKQTGKHLVPCHSCPRAYHTECLSPALSKIFIACGCYRKVPRGKWQCPGCNQKGGRKKIPKKLKIYIGSPDSEDTNSNGNQNSNNAVSVTTNVPASASVIPKKDKTSEPADKDKDNNIGKEDTTDQDIPSPPDPKKAKKEAKKKAKIEKDLTPCQILVMELESCDDSWPFLYPVNTKQFPTYRKIIKNPMDIATIKRKLENGNYKTREEFCDDVRLIFANCEIFNEDDSPVGKAGHAMRHLFNTRWVELIGQESK